MPIQCIFPQVDRIKYIMPRPNLLDLNRKWWILLKEFQIIYIAQRDISSQALIDHPILTYWELYKDFSNKGVFLVENQYPWRIFVDETSHQEGASVRIIFVTPHPPLFLYSYRKLDEQCS